jgi:hypothetical protein
MLKAGLALGYPKLVASVVDEEYGDDVHGQHCPMNKFLRISKLDLQWEWEFQMHQSAIIMQRRESQLN